MSKRKHPKSKEWGTNAGNMGIAYAVADDGTIHRVLAAPLPKHGKSSSVADVLPPRSTPRSNLYRREGPMPKPRAKNLSKSDGSFASPGNDGDLTPDQVDEMVRLLDDDPEANEMVEPGHYRGNVERDPSRTEKALIRQIARIEIGTRLFKALEQQVAAKDASDPLKATQDGSRDQLARLGVALTRSRLRFAAGGRR